MSFRWDRLTSATSPHLSAIWCHQTADRVEEERTHTKPTTFTIPAPQQHTDQRAMSSLSCTQRAGSRILCHHATTEQPCITPAHGYLLADADAPAPICSDCNHAMAGKPDRVNSEPKNNRLLNCKARIPTAMAKPKKSVRWSTITVHEFGVGVGGSAVSNKGGPSIGLADPPEFTWTTRVGEMAECVEGVHRFTRSQRIRLLQAAGIPDGIITRHARETNIILGSRRRSTTSWEDSKLKEAEEEGDEEECTEVPRKRSAHQAALDHPCAVYLRRPRMIPVNYV